MKRSIILTILCCLALGRIAAQDIVIGERVPEIKPTEWLGQRPDASDRRPTLIVFFHTESDPCADMLPHLDSLGRSIRQMKILVMAMEPKERIAPSLARYLGDRFFAAVDSTGKTFASYGIKYVPFCVLVDSRGRALWIGNPVLATEETLRKNLN